jgi:excisionase family DNA binding protein
MDETMKPNGGDWLTVNEAAGLTGYNPEYIRELIRQGRITARKFSIVWMVNRESLLSYQAQAQALGEKRGRKPEN